MEKKRLIVFLMTLVLIFVMVGPVFSKEIKGTVTKIEGKKITVKNVAGEEITIEVKEVPTGHKVGDSITIRDGTVVPSAKEKPLEGCFSFSCSGLCRS